MHLIWLIPLLPALGALVNGLVGVRVFGRRASGVLACLALVGSFGLSAFAFAQLLAQPPDARVHDVALATWIPRIPLLLDTAVLGGFSVTWGLRLDALAAVMLLVVTGIGSVIHVYATGYMAEEPRGGYARFFAYLNLFCAFMLLLVLGSNFLVLFVGWEGVGLASYLLIGFHYQRTSAADAGRKAFLTNRIGDWGFLLGILLIFTTFGTFDFREIAGMVEALPEGVHVGAITTIGLCLFIGATGKSAQVPLHVWLPDAMEGPTPVSALIHAATMVTAGVYMVARNAVLFSHAPGVMTAITVTGVVTAFVAASIALVQPDIKRVLAYSTVSQLGYMFTALGLGGFAAAIFHLVTHAFFKALLFLGSGSVIHALGGEQDMRRMGGLRKYLPVTYTTMAIGAFAIAGVPPLAGFFSKDGILLQAFLANRAVWAVAVLTALLTAFYMYRLIALTFLGEERRGEESQGGAREGDASRREEADAHAPLPHESPSVMTMPLMVLAVGSMVVGFFGVPAVLFGTDAVGRLLGPVFPEPGGASAHAAGTHGLTTGGELGLMALSVAVAVGGMLLARRFFVTHPDAAGRLARRWPRLHALLLRRYFFDEVYGATVVRGTTALARGLWRVDTGLVDGLVNGSGKLTLITAWFSGLTDRAVVDRLVTLTGAAVGEAGLAVRRLQSGLVQNYALLMLFGVFAFVTLYLFV
ncbi:MAG: NADH-quinone oxidoreductase subunit L [Vicinamibacterales bacterium]